MRNNIFGSKYSVIPVKTGIQLIKDAYFMTWIPACAGMTTQRLQKGQALITLLFFTIIGITITSAAVVMILVNAKAGSKFQQGIVAYHIAQSGAENGVLRLLRNPSYTGENDLVIGNGTADITVTGDGSSGNPFVITSTGQTGNLVRNIEIRATYINNLLTVTSEKEIFN